MSTEAERMWVWFAGEVVDASRRELGTRRVGKNKNYGVATRDLQKSLSFKLKKGKGKVQAVELMATGKASRYAAFMHWGVNGTQVRRGSPYSYRDKQPPISAVREWMKVKPVRLRDPKTGEFIKQTERGLNSAAFLIARSIKRKGIEGVRYFVNGFEWAMNKHGDTVAETLGRDFAQKLSARIGTITIKSK
jgi:hypothetical protein